MTESAQLTQWQVGGNTAEAYERYLVPALFHEGAQQLVMHAGIQPGDRVLDVGSGTGIVARIAAEHAGEAGEVEGVDVNPGMVDVARTTSAQTYPQIGWRQGAAEDLPFAGSTFDAVLSQQAFQFFEDRQAALKEMRRVLRPGGRLAFSVLRSTEHNHTYQALIEAFRRHGGDDLGTMMQSPFQDWSIDDLRSMVTDAGFESVSVTVSLITARFPSVPEFIEQELSSSPLSDIVATMEDSVREAIARDVSIGLQEYIDDRGVIHPLQTYLIHARK
jgi:ubiquinone/menaquinone biosynthesis C-methylase UbiE